MDKARAMRCERPTTELHTCAATVYFGTSHSGNHKHD